MKEIKWLEFLKDEKEKTEKRLKVMSPKELEAQAAKLAAYEAKRAKMLEEYNHYINFRADPLPITKINYRVNNSTKEASIRIIRHNQPLSLIAYDMFVLKILDSVNGLKEEKEKSSKLFKKVFVKEDIVMDGMHRNLVPPPGFMPSEGLVISEPVSGIFFYDGNFDLVFQRENEFHLATIPQLIRIQNAVKVDSKYADEMYRKMIYVIKARDDVVEARKMVQDNLDNMGQN
ncbi:hypothetical protein Tco_1058145 [Tanacetum coccineum]|uniref:Uncharacterized protein n=1 Tax=Tanacetum coccineum TaxID=301880 RepID=A0ABQ5H7V8_9ASTR